jgi:hypothetical protein
MMDPLDEVILDRVGRRVDQLAASRPTNWTTQTGSEDHKFSHPPRSTF